MVRYNRADAWSFLGRYGGETDTVEMKRCRVAWTELSMFAKSVLIAEKRGVRPAQAYMRAKIDSSNGLVARESAYGKRLFSKINVGGPRQKIKGVLRIKQGSNVLIN